MLLVRNGRREDGWSFGEIGASLAAKHRLIKTAAQRAGELGDSPAAYLEKVIAVEIGMTPQRWSSATKGRERPGHKDYVTIHHLRALAAYFHLDAEDCLGEDAWLVYTPAVTINQLEQRLLDAGYAGISYRRKVNQRAVDDFLAWLRDAHRLTRQGIGVALAREASIAASPTRATGVVDEEMEEEERTTALFRAHDRITVQLSAEQGWFGVLLQVTDAATPPFFTLRCLLPSYRHPTTELYPGLTLPAGDDGQGRPGFGLGSDPGLLDFVAVLTRDRPFPLPFTIPGTKRFHVIDPALELPHIKASLAALEPSSLRVLHAPLRVI